MEAGAPRAVVMFSPLPPQPNGIADYTAELLAPLSLRLECTMVVADGCFDAKAPDGVTVLQAHQYAATGKRFADLLHVYHLGNNVDHVYMLPFLAVRPGLVVLHDPALHHLLDCATVARDDPHGYLAALETDYGVPGAVLGEQFRRYWLREQRLYFDLPMLRALLGPQRGVIVHSRFAAARVLAQVPQAPVSVVPHQFSPPDPAIAEQRDTVRAALGIGAEELLFLSLGFVGRVKLIDAALRAFAAISDRLPPFRYVIAGELRPDEFDPAALAQALGIEDRVLLTGYVAEADFFAFIAAADVLVNLRHPVGGETSGTMVRALGSGACVVLVDRGAFAEVPDDAAAKVPPFGPGFEAALAATLLELAHDPARRAAIGAAARRHTARRHRIEATVEGYLAAIARAAARPSPRWATSVRWQTLPPAALAQAVAAAQAGQPAIRRLPLWFAAGALPIADRPCRALAIGATPGDLDRLAAAAGAAPATLALDDLLTAPPPARSLDLALLLLAADRRAAECRGTLLALNRALAFGGIVVIGLVRADPAAPRLPLEDAAQATALLAACGFQVEFTTALLPAWLDDAFDPGPAPAQEERCWRVAKVSEFALGPDRSGLRARIRAIIDGRAPATAA